MNYLVNGTEMKQYDAFTIQKIGIPSMVLMERAALSVMEELKNQEFSLKKVLVVCGAGNNGGDGLAIARMLLLKGLCVEVVFAGEEEKATNEVKIQLQILRNYGFIIENNIKGREYTTIIDSLFGIGISRDIKGIYAHVIEKINDLSGRVLSVDIPSGISADTGKIMGVAVKADTTVSFAYKKLGTSLYPGAEFSGNVIVKDIGISERGFQGSPPFVYTYDSSDLIEMPKRSNYSNKGTYGKVLMIAGTYNMGGAAYLSGKSAYVTGAGLIRIYTPSENREILQTLLPEAVLTTYDKDNVNMEELEEAVKWADVVGIGPGLGTGEASAEILKKVVAFSKVPMVIDADGINIIAKNKELIKNHGQPIIMTPHLGEMSRLIRKEISYIADHIMEETHKFAKENGVICVLKDTRTAVSDGSESIYINESGNNGMSTGGSGDVLTGIITALLAQGLKEIKAASLGVYIHGLAGDCAARKKGYYSLMASDIINGITDVLK